MSAETGGQRAICRHLPFVVGAWLLLGLSGTLLVDSLVSARPLLGELLARSLADKIFWLLQLLLLTGLGAAGVWQFSCGVFETPTGLRFQRGSSSHARWYSAPDVASWDAREIEGWTILRIEFRDGRSMKALCWSRRQRDLIVSGLPIAGKSLAK